MTVAELDLGNDFLQHFHQVFVGPFDRLAGREPRRRMRYEGVADSRIDTHLSNAALHAVRDVENLLVSLR
jgi:hypothetical protein